MCKNVARRFALVIPYVFLLTWALYPCYLNKLNLNPRTNTSAMGSKKSVDPVRHPIRRRPRPTAGAAIDLKT